MHLMIFKAWLYDFEKWYFYLNWIINPFDQIIN